MNGGQLTEGEALGDIDVQLAGVDHPHELGELSGVAAREDGHGANARRLVGHCGGEGAEHDPAGADRPANAPSSAGYDRREVQDDVDRRPDRFDDRWSWCGR